MKIRTRRRGRRLANWSRFVIATPFIFVGMLCIAFAMALSDDDKVSPNGDPS